MPLAPGTRLGAYEILSPIGAGGMGEVYKARDSQLNRAVAIKILPQSLANDSDYITRFQREAQSLAALNHPNIATIFGLEQNAIVMELVDGKPLQGPLPLSEVLQIARQIAEALEAAHEKGIIHRDLKPANILLTPEGTVKILDFGLAKAIDRPTENSPNSPTLTLRATEAGLILGTAAYMAPEQAAGKAVDRRADIWSFGVVLHELITGKQLFQGETVSHTLAEVLKTEINFTPIPAGPIRDLLKRCLDRNLKSRLQHIGEARIAIENYPNAVRPAPPQSKQLHWALIATAALTTTLAAWALLRPQHQQTQSTIRVSIPVLGAHTVDGLGVAISRDGQYLAYAQSVGENASVIMLRRTDQFDAKPLPGTEGAVRLHFSPDGQWIYFTDGLHTRKIALSGGPVLSVYDANGGLGKTWDRDNALILGGSPLVRLRPEDGKAANISKLEAGENSHRWPFLLPGRDSVLFNSINSYDSNDVPIEVLDLKSGARRLLPVKGGSPRYVPTGHLVYARNGTLFAVPFDVNQLSVTGPEVPVIQDVFHNTSGAYTDYSFSDTGHLLYHSETRATPQELHWANRDGTARPVPGGPRMYAGVELSPNGSRIAAAISRGSNGGDVWVQDLDRGINARLTAEGIYSRPLWAPDGRSVSFGTLAGEILTATPEGGAKPTILVPAGTGRVSQRPDAWTPDGRTLFFTRREGRQYSIWATEPSANAGQPAPRKLLSVRGTQPVVRISPDGKSFAYTSNESGAIELYVQTYPSPGQRVQVSATGATQCVWSPDGKQIYFKSSISHSPLMAVSIQVHGTEIRAGRPERLFDFDGNLSGITPDGKQFLMVKSEGGAMPSPKLNLVLNWFDELRRLSPATTAPPRPAPS